MTAPAARAGLTHGEFRAAAASGADWGKTTKACLDGLGSTDGANLGIVYLSDGLVDHSASILTLLKQITGIEAWVGAVGMGVCTAGAELFDRPALSVMVGRLAPGSFRLLHRFADAGLDRDTADWLAANAPAVGLIHADPREPNLAATIGALAAQSEAFLVGGLSSSRGAHSQICATAGEGGLSGVLFGRDVPVITGLSQGCSPIGPARLITAAHDNVIEEIDGRAALDVFKDDIGDLLAHDLRRTAGYIFAALPVTGSDTGDFLVRNVVGMGVDEGWLAIADIVSPGQRVMFTRRDRDSAVKDLGRMLADVGRRLAKRRPRGALYVSCVARGPNLFGTESEELRQVGEALGDVPLAGFFANGEISHDRLYGHTGVLTLFL
ncbi:MAG: FIST C-terminal domain-containing protein [Alphaproteobacteria bacterium]